ncbi:hypothetical protein, partial [Mesorhizobium sp. M4B.F.Ca.ET.089.01.1.1]|uniref:hypothetical protein n=1 Tax=Mesorhizobium sp. M4B.F.Ca.ET.089.01.1.1 TaxID=2496662 RepID=UPI001AEC90B4
RYWGHKSYVNESLTAQNESPFIGHAFLLRARPESSEAGLFSRILCVLPTFPPVHEAGGSVGIGWGLGGEKGELSDWKK